MRAPEEVAGGSTRGHGGLDTETPSRGIEQRAVPYEVDGGQLDARDERAPAWPYRGDLERGRPDRSVIREAVPRIVVREHLVPPTGRGGQEGRAGLRVTLIEEVPSGHEVDEVLDTSAPIRKEIGPGEAILEPDAHRIVTPPSQTRLAPVVNED